MDCGEEEKVALITGITGQVILLIIMEKTVKKKAQKT